MSRIAVEWTGPNEYGELVASVPGLDYRGQGFFVFHAMPRPPYCDRGSWLVLVETIGIDGLDCQEGFPRYYFDTDRMKAEIEDWANKRESCIKAAQLAGQIPRTENAGS